MAGIVGLTELQHTNATSAMTIDTSGNLTIKTGTTTVKGEGTATTNLQQGLCKSWISFDGAGTISTYDSFNIGSLTDVGTGDYGFTYTNNMRAANSYTLAGSCIGSLESNHYSFITSSADTLATTGTNFQLRHHASTINDQDPVGINTHGDLA